MRNIGGCRLRIYDLLFHKPLCDYASQGEIRVLILGSGWVGSEAWKASFWAGQFVDTNLHITVGSPHASKDQAESERLFPALRLFAEKKGYAHLDFRDLWLEEGEACFGPLEIANTRYHYVILALGDAARNWLVASELIAQIQQAKAAGGYPGKTLLAVFCTADDPIEAPDQVFLRDAGERAEIEVCFFGEETESAKRLETLAKNLNFAYEMEREERCSKAQADARLEAETAREFFKAPAAAHPLENCTGSAYYADRAFACAVSIPYILAVCRTQYPEKDAIETLEEAIHSQNALYDTLLSLTHRRWNAYMVMRGYRAPTVAEEESVLYHGENDHEDTVRLLHIALCDCGEGSAHLQEHFDRKYQFWQERDFSSPLLSELDRATLRCHQLTGRLTEQLDKKAILRCVRGDCMEYINYRQSIQKLFNDENNAVAVYLRALEGALDYARSVSEEECARIQDVHRMLAVARARNLRMDFLDLDAKALGRIPFAIWYGTKYRCVVTISEGVAIQDVVIPTLFSAQEAVFMGEGVEEAAYQEAIQDYFTNRGLVLTPRFLPQRLTSDLDVVHCITELLEQYTLDQVVIQCAKRYEIAVAIGRLIERYHGKLHIVIYDHGRVCALSGDRNIAGGLQEKHFSVHEYIRLAGGQVTNSYNALYDTTQYDSLREIYRKYSEVRRIAKNWREWIYTIPWNDVAYFFSQYAKDEDPIEPTITGEAHMVEETYLARFPAENFDTNVGNVLKKMQEYRILRNYTAWEEGEDVTVEFVYYDPEIIEAIRPFESGQPMAHPRQLKFLPLYGLKVANCYVDHQMLYAADEPEIVREGKERLLRELQQKGFIRDLSIDDEGYTSCVFRDEPTLNLLRKQGSAFEISVYHTLRETGIFDDLETGTMFKWDANSLEPSLALLEVLNAPGNTRYGYRYYARMREEVVRQANKNVRNEIDIIAIKGMRVLFISCKTGKKQKIDWIYEIASLAANFGAVGVLALSNELPNATFSERAKQIGVDLWSADILWDAGKLSKAIDTALYGHA